MNNAPLEEKIKVFEQFRRHAFNFPGERPIIGNNDRARRLVDVNLFAQFWRNKDMADLKEGPTTGLEAKFQELREGNLDRREAYEELIPEFVKMVGLLIEGSTTWSKFYLILNYYYLTLFKVSRDTVLAEHFPEYLKMYPSYVHVIPQRGYTPDGVI